MKRVKFLILLSVVMLLFMIVAQTTTIDKNITVNPTIALVVNPDSIDATYTVNVITETKNAYTLNEIPIIDASQQVNNENPPANETSAENTDGQEVNQHLKLPQINASTLYIT